MTAARRAVWVFALLLVAVVVAGLVGIGSGHSALPYLLAAIVPVVGLQIALRRARGAGAGGEARRMS
jgi:hypothetical protein